MTAINFPINPTVGQIFSISGRSWLWTGAVWNAANSSELQPPALIATSPIQYNDQSGEISIDVSAINKPLEDITNVNIVSVANGQALVFDASTSKWINATVDVQGAIDTANAYTDSAVAAIPAPDFTGYATETYVSTAISNIPPADLTSYATESYVNTAVSNMVDSAPETLNTLNELAAALADDPDFATTVSATIASKADRVISFVQQSGSYTIGLQDMDKMIDLNGSAAITLTVPADTSTNFPIGATVSVLQSGLGQVTVSPESGVTINSTPGLSLRTQWSSASLVKRSANTWLLSGDLE